MSHPNRNWRKAWRLDVATLTATHESGLRIIGKLNDDGSLDVELDNATMPVPGEKLSPEDVLEFGRDIGRRVQEGGRLLYAAVHKPKLP